MQTAADIRILGTEFWYLQG